MREGVLVGVIKRVKIPKIKGHGATFMSLRACDGDYKEGVCHDIKTEIESFYLRWVLQWYVIKIGV